MFFVILSIETDCTDKFHTHMLTGSDTLLQEPDLLAERVDTVQLLQRMRQEVGPLGEEAVTVSHIVQREERGEGSQNHL